MRKLSKTRSAHDKQYKADDANLDTRPRGIAGATITSWNASIEIDLTSLFARSAPGTSVTGSASAGPVGFERNTVALSDGTKITFATTDDP